MTDQKQFTPDLETVRWAYFSERAQKGQDKPTPAQIESEFQRWLNQFVRQIRAEAWDKGYGACESDFASSNSELNWPDGYDRNPYSDD